MPNRSFALALNIDSKSRVVLTNLAAEYQYLGRDSDAVVSLRQARAVGPDSAVLMINLGDSLRRLGQASEAKAAYLRGLELTRAVTSQNSRDAVSALYLAYFLVRLNQSKAGRVELEQALGLDERNTTVRRRAILCFAASGDKTRAIALYARRLPILCTTSSATPTWPRSGRIRRSARLLKSPQANKIDSSRATAP
jgi:Tfp pilus assembly protein PilF